SRAFYAVERLGSVLYVQKAIRHPGFDYRAFVLGGRILGAFRRFAPDGDWRTNVAVGGPPGACVVQPPLPVLRRPAPPPRMAGVDILIDHDRDGPVVLEVNAVPGWRALAKVTGVDVAAAILEHLRGLG